MACKCSSFCCSEFVTFQEGDIHTLTGESDLQNDIHPIFRKSNFTDDFDYSLMEVPLRLASLLLESPAMVPFINTIFHPDFMDENGNPTTWGDIDAWYRDPANAGWYLEIILSGSSGQDQITKKTRVIAHKILRRFAETVRFTFQEDDEQSSAFCECLRGPLNKDLAKHFRRGCMSLITLNKSVAYNRLASSTHKRSRLRASTLAKAKSTQHVLRDTINLAITLVHEVGHALNHAACGDSVMNDEPFYADNTYSEMGYIVEQILFGGRPEQFYSPESFGPDACDVALARPNPEQWTSVVTEMPSRRLEELCKAASSCFSARGQPAPAYEVRWRVPISYWQSLLTTAFWEEVDRDGTATALFPPRVAGWVFHTLAGGSLLPASIDRPGHKRVREKLLQVLGHH